MGSKRQPKVSPQQQETLVEYLEAHPQFVDMKFSPNFTRQIYNNMWDELATRLNALGGAQKDVAHWRVSLSDWKTNLRKKIAAIKKKVTGGGEQPDNGLSPLEERLITVLGRATAVGDETVLEGGFGPDINQEQPVELFVSETNPGHFVFESGVLDDVEPSPSTSRQGSGSHEGEDAIQTASPSVVEGAKKILSARGRKRMLERMEPLESAAQHLKELHGASHIHLEGLRLALLEQADQQRRQADASERIAKAQERRAKAAEDQVLANQRANEIQAQFAAALVAMAQAINRHE